MNKKLVAAVCGTALCLPAFAGVNRIFYPTVEYREMELEARQVQHRGDGEKAEEITKFDLAYGVTPWWFTELEFERENVYGDERETESAVSSENIFQFTEQGEYFADFGFFAEYEKVKVLEGEEKGMSAHAIALGPILQKEFGNFVATANIFWEKEFIDGDPDDADVAEEVAAEHHRWERADSFQLKYRAGTLEPGIEYYGEEEAKSVGPVLLGAHRFGHTKFKWQLGWYFGMNDESADQSLRWMMEFEF